LVHRAGARGRGLVGAARSQPAPPDQSGGSDYISVRSGDRCGAARAPPLAAPPRLTAPIATRTLLVTALASRPASSGRAPNKPAQCTREGDAPVLLAPDVQAPAWQGGGDVGGRRRRAAPAASAFRRRTRHPCRPGRDPHR